MSLIENFVLPPEYANSDEKSYCNKWILSRRLHRARLAVLMSFFGHILGLMQASIFYHLEGATNFVTLHLVGFLTSFLALPLLTRNSVLLLPLVNIVAVVSVLSYQVLHFVTLSPDSLISQSTSLVYSANIIVIFLFLPFERRELLAACLLLGFVALCLWHHTPQWRFAIFESVNIGFFSCFVGMFFISREERAAIKSYERLKRIVPRQIIRQDNVVTETSIFEPKYRECICIASDWRGYQKLAKALEPHEMASHLATYYEMCEEVLERNFPNGNYFSDWIADELFVVVFSQEGPLPESSFIQALKFSEDLINTKKVFCMESNIKEFGIDVGLSHGEAVIGLLGPDSHGKTTALGEVPGLARRVQSVGKLLRSRISDRDRVVFVDEVFDKRCEGKIETYESDRPLRDLKATSVKYMDPADQLINLNEKESA